jgi:hypothetical protein
MISMPANPPGAGRFERWDCANAQEMPGRKKRWLRHCRANEEAQWRSSFRHRFFL